LGGTGPLACTMPHLGNERGVSADESKCAKIRKIKARENLGRFRNFTDFHRKKRHQLLKSIPEARKLSKGRYEFNHFSLECAVYRTGQQWRN